MTNEILESNIDNLLSAEKMKKDVEVPQGIVDIEKEYLRRLRETNYILPTQELAQFLHKILLAKEFYQKKEALMRANTEKWKSLKEQVFAKEKSNIEKGSDAERGRKVLADSELYRKADRLYHHYNKLYRFFEVRGRSMEDKLNSCKAIYKKDDFHG